MFFRQIEDLILDEANDIMEDEEVFDPAKADHMIMHRVNAARDLEIIRKALVDLEKVMFQIRRENSDDNALDMRKRGEQDLDCVNWLIKLNVDFWGDDDIHWSTTLGCVVE